MWMFDRGQLLCGMTWDLGGSHLFSFTAGYLSERSDLGLELSTITKVNVCLLKKKKTN